jgi:hypothetical protein
MTEPQFGFHFEFTRLTFRQHHQAISLLEEMTNVKEKSKLFDAIEKAFALCISGFKPVDESQTAHPLDVLTLPEVTRVVGLAIAANNVSEDERKK